MITASFLSNSDDSSKYIFKGKKRVNVKSSTPGVGEMVRLVKGLPYEHEDWSSIHAHKNLGVGVHTCNPSHGGKRNSLTSQPSLEVTGH